MRLLICTTDVDPCPAGQQVWTTTGEILQPAELGITGADVAAVYAAGFAAVLGAWLLGYPVGIALSLIRKM